MDWGSASPFSVGWWAIVQDDHALANGGIVLPRGCMVRYREWYGMRPGEPNVGLKLHAEEVGKGIAEREQGESIAYGVLDPSAFKEDGGPSIAERIARGSGGKVWFRHADNTRVPARGAMGGWDRCARGWWATVTAAPCLWCSRRASISSAPCRSCSTTRIGPRT